MPSGWRERRWPSATATNRPTARALPSGVSQRVWRRPAEPRYLHVKAVAAVLGDHVRVHREDHVLAQLGLDALADLRELDHRHPDRVARDVAQVITAVDEPLQDRSVRLVRGRARPEGA